MTPRHLGITMGDSAGIGPEIIVKACNKLKSRIDGGSLRLLIIGSGPALERAREQFGAGIQIPEVQDGAEWPALCFLQAGPEGDPIEPGRLSADGGRFAYLAVERGVRLAQAGRIDAIVTGPLNKEALNKAGPTTPATPNAGGTHRRARLGDDAGPQQHAGEPCHDPHRPGGRSEAADPRAPAPGHRPDPGSSPSPGSQSGTDRRRGA